MPPEWNGGGILFLSCLSVTVSVCLSVFLWLCGSVAKNFNLGYNFWTVRDKDFVFGMHVHIMKPFQMTPRSMTLWPWLWLLYLKKQILDFVATGAFVFHKHTRVFIFFWDEDSNGKLGQTAVYAVLKSIFIYMYLNN